MDVKSMSDDDLKRKIEELKESNEVVGLALQRSRLAVKRLKLEYGVLLERLEARAELDPELDTFNPLPSLETFNKELLATPLKKPKTRRQKIKDRDPNMPKRPTNAYLLFCEMNKDKVRESGSVDVTKDLTENWKNLTEQERKPYYRLYNEDRERYQAEMEVYNKKGKTDDAGPVSVKEEPTDKDSNKSEESDATPMTATTTTATTATTDS